jgi:hypothetical protein
MVGMVLYAVVLLKGGTVPSGRKGRVDRAMVAGRWRVIEQTANTGASGLKQSVAEADKLLDYVMRQEGYPGTTMAERLKRVQARLSDREAVWQAHKLRNAFAHDVDHDLVPAQARQAVQAFKQALQDLGAL